MFSVPDFLDRAKAGAGNCTDYRLSKLVGVTTQAVSAWRTGRTAPDERAILKLCELSGDDPEHVAACIQSMRAANDDAADLWRRIAARLKQGGAASVAFALAVVFVVLSSLYGAPALADDVGSALRIMSTVAAVRLAARLMRLASRTRTATVP